MGSRYGGLKQIDGIGPSGETILDYSAFDAIRAGFGKVLFVVRRSMEDAFRRYVLERISDSVETGLVFQELDMLPTGPVRMAERQKPWGTAHALWCARNHVDTPFVVLNADDFYGAESFRIAADFLQRACSSSQYGLVGFPVDQTLSEHGPVSRGICEVDDGWSLLEVGERLQVQMTDEGPAYRDDGGVLQLIPEGRVASMNMWALHPTVFDALERDFRAFLDRYGSDPDEEFLIPTVFNQLVREGNVRISVLPTTSRWFGLTYPEDRSEAAARIRSFVERGVYPTNLWASLQRH
jgi:NDP-sugar pyrophosphorylase family protein